MRNPLDESSIAQNLDGERLMGSLLSPGQELHHFAEAAQWLREVADHTVGAVAGWPLNGPQKAVDQVDETDGRCVVVTYANRGP